MKTLNPRQFFIISNIWFSAFWFSCVFAANNLSLHYQVMVCVGLLSPLLFLTKTRQLDLKLTALVILLGIVMDYGLFKLNLHQFINDQFPYWLIMLWVGFGLYVGLIHQDLAKLNPIVLVIVSSIITPISYAYGITIGLIHWPLGPIYSYLIMCCAWLAFICTIILLRFLVPFNWPQLAVVFVISCLVLIPGLSHASTTNWQQWQKVGSAQLNVLFWTVYDSTLSTPNGQFESTQQPLALSIDYRMDIKADDLLEATQEQWEHLGYSETQQLKWIPALKALWPDIKEDDNLTFVVMPDKASFFYNKQHLGDIEDNTLAQSFIAIWLSEDTKYKKLRRQLINASK